MKDLVIAIRNYNKRNYKTYIDAIRKAGFRNVFIEWYNKDLKLQQDILDYVKANELNIIFAHLGYQNPSVFWLEGTDGDKEVKRYINDLNECKKNGLDIVVMHTTDGYKYQPMNELGIKRLTKIIKHAEKNNMKIAFENIELQGYLEYIFDNIDSHNIGICYDAGHCHLFFDNKFNTKRFRDKTLLIHLHDNFKKIDNHNLPFDGTLDWNDVIKKIIELNYRGYVIMECGPNDHYNNLSVDEYYKLAYERGTKIKELLEKEYKESK